MENQKITAKYQKSSYHGPIANFTALTQNNETDYRELRMAWGVKV